MRKALFLLVLPIVGAVAAQDSPRPSTEQLLRQAAQETPAGARARAVLTNEASARAEEIIKFLAEGDDDVRVSAAWVLRACDHPKAVGALVAAMRDANFSVARTAVMTLKEKKAADAPLAEMLSDKDPAMRWRAAANIGHAFAVGAAPGLIKVATGDDAEYVRIEAIQSMTVAPTADAAGALAQCFAEGSAGVRDAAGASFDAICARLNKKDRAAQGRIIEALAAILEKHPGKPYAVKMATERLSAILLSQLGGDAAKWRRALAATQTQPAGEGEK